MTAVDQQEVREGVNCTWCFICPKRIQMMKEITTRCEGKGTGKELSKQGTCYYKTSKFTAVGFIHGHFCWCERTQRNRMKNEQDIISYDVKIKPTCKCPYVNCRLVPIIYFFVWCSLMWNGEVTVLNYSSTVVSKEKMIMSPWDHEYNCVSMCEWHIPKVWWQASVCREAVFWGKMENQKCSFEGKKSWSCYAHIFQ